MAAYDITDRKPAPWYDRISDWFNAILIREARQCLKSRQFVVTFFLLLGISWVVSVFFLLTSGSALEFGAVGRSLFLCFYAVLALSAVVIIPFGAYRSLLSERDLNTFELLSITTLSPRQIVWGKLLSAGLQLFLFYSAITPFMAFASLLQGFNSASAGVILVATMLLSLFLSMGALMMSAFARYRVLTGLITVAVLMGLVSTYWNLIGGVFFLVSAEFVRVLDPEFWWMTTLLLLTGTCYFVLFQQITVAQLTFDSDNRSTGIRIVCVAHFWLLWGAFAVFCYVRSMVPSNTTIQILAGLSALHWSIAGLIFTSEGDHLSRRVRRQIPRNRLLRLYVGPFLPGGSRGLLLAWKHLAALWMIVAIVQGLDGMRPAGLSLWNYYAGLCDPLSSSWTTNLRFTTVVCSYAVIFLGITAVLSRWGRRISNEIGAAHVRVVVILLFTAGVIFPLVLRASELLKQRDYSVYDLTSAPITCQYITQKSSTTPFTFDWSNPSESVNALIRTRGHADVIVILLATAAFIAVAVNFLAIVHGIRNLQPIRPSNPNAVGDEKPTVEQP